MASQSKSLTTRQQISIKPVANSIVPDSNHNSVVFNPGQFGYFSQDWQTQSCFSQQIRVIIQIPDGMRSTTRRLYMQQDIGHYLGMTACPQDDNSHWLGLTTHKFARRRLPGLADALALVFQTTILTFGAIQVELLYISLLQFANHAQDATLIYHLQLKSRTAEGILKPFSGEGSTRSVCGKRNAESCEVNGATSNVGKPGVSSWATTAGRRPDCSRPTPPKGGGSSTMTMSLRFMEKFLEIHERLSRCHLPTL